MNELNKQWKKGELDIDECYFAETDGGIYKATGEYLNSSSCIDGFDITAILEPVPDYVEWRNMVNCACEEHEANHRLLEENDKLKEWCEELNAFTLKVAKENAQLKEDYKRMEKLLQKMEESDNAREKFQNEQIEKLKEALKDCQEKILLMDYDSIKIEILQKIDEVLK